MRVPGSAVTRPAINVAAGKSRTGNDNVSTFRRRPDGNTNRDNSANTLRRRPADRSTRRVVSHTRRYTRPAYRYGYRRGYGYGYYDGYTWGYHRGYHVGYHVGYSHSHYYRHRHWYGPHLVFGYHFGGFGFYHGHWHFAIVIGSPYVSHHHHYYHYSWWDGRGASLVTWDRAVQAYPADYTFGSGSCVALWVRTTAGVEYKVQIDPRYYNVGDPGELYALLWAELENEGQLQIEDINGVIHVFPAGMIQQIEATACR
ncbi:MAG: hypothetical protein JSV86_16165 [Gemmatimonadota bacterium]|nr:MAG: hypothetical protein JSV86_16165 [Gemmatimonadota bacterium]